MSPTAVPAASRKEKQAQTREALLEAALELIAAKGLEGATIDAIAARAGYTKGAFYANFSSKQELFLTMLEQHFAEEVERLDELLEAETEPIALAREEGLEFIRRVRSDPRWQSLYFQFTVYATRDEEFRRQLVERYTDLVDRLERIFRNLGSERAMEPAMGYRDLAEITFFMADGFLLHQLVDDEVGDELYGRMLATFFTGVIAGSG